MGLKSEEPSPDTQPGTFRDSGIVPMSSPVTIIIDESLLDSYRELQEEGQADVVTEFIDLFLDDLAGRLTQINEAIQAKDLKAIRSAAHALRGSAASIGA